MYSKLIFAYFYISGAGSSSARVRRCAPNYYAFIARDYQKGPIKARFPWNNRKLQMVRVVKLRYTFDCRFISFEA